MRWLAVVVVAFGLVVAGAAPAWPATTNVSIVGFSFQPGSVTVNPGDTVTWTNNDAATHTVTADDNSFNSGDVTTGQTFSHTFAQVGTFAYHCNHHASMHGTVTVQGAGGATTTTTAAPATTTTVAPTPTTARPATTTTAKPVAATTTTAARAVTTTSISVSTSTSAALDTTTSSTSSTTSTTELAAAKTGSKGGGGGVPVVLVLVGLLAVAGAGGYGLWRLWPGRGGDAA